MEWINTKMQINYFREVYYFTNQCVAIHAIVGTRNFLSKYAHRFSQIKRTARITDVEHGLPATSGDGDELKLVVTVGLQCSKYAANTMARNKCEMRASRRPRVNIHPLINCSSHAVARVIDLNSDLSLFYSPPFLIEHRSFANLSVLR